MNWYTQDGWWFITIVDQYCVTCGPFKICRVGDRVGI